MNIYYLFSGRIDTSVASGLLSQPHPVFCSCQMLGFAHSFVPLTLLLFLQICFATPIFNNATLLEVRNSPSYLCLSFLTCCLRRLETRNNPHICKTSFAPNLQLAHYAFHSLTDGDSRQLLGRDLSMVRSECIITRAMHSRTFSPTPTFRTKTHTSGGPTLA
jgi:hypothetical protein